MADNYKISSSPLAAQGGVEHSHESTPLLPTNAFRAAHHSISRRIAHEGESGRDGFHIRHLLCVLWRSSCTASMFVNVIWPIVPSAVVLWFLLGLHLSKFATASAAVVPSANLLGFAGQEFSWKMPKAAGILIETTFVSMVETIIFIVLILKHETCFSREWRRKQSNPYHPGRISREHLDEHYFALAYASFSGGFAMQVKSSMPLYLRSAPDYF